MHGRGKSCENGLTRRGFVVAGAGAAAALAVPSWARARGGSAAELVLLNGRVHTAAGGADAEALAISGGRITYVGSTAGARALAGPATEVIDARGRDGDARDPRRPHASALAAATLLTQPTPQLPRA